MNDLLIVGTGALACLFAARLAARGMAVNMLGSWREGLAALRNYGVTLVESDGSQHSYPVTVVDDAVRCNQSRYALVLVKSWQTERAARQLANCLHPDGLALTLQNGLGNGETLAAVLGPERVAQGITTTGATLLSSGRVRPGGEGTISLENNPRLEPIQNMLTASGFRVETVGDVSALLWSKLVVNAAINPLTAILKINNGILLDLPSARKLSADLANEVAAVANAIGVDLSHLDPVAISAQVAANTARNQSSMYQDILRGAPTEIDAICGEVVRIGEQAGIPTPVNYTVWRLVHAFVEKNT
ncbi:MAG: 2-dehydropantoate 2-reductase [Anaerolineales bacterium]|nr:2-dehydropantoate 2-reductase [Anaerolineales bacterium]